MTRYTSNGFWLSSLTGVMAAIGVVASYPFPTLAQIAPDQTLGAEASRLTPNVDVRGGLADRIDGGAIRGSNLFHSFQDFNVKELQRVYFANPQGIENILGRVTGSTRSNILGTLGVDGGANLFLINPNGILFGPNAKLDIRGSFLAGTADGFKFPDGSEFRAKDPNAPPLVTVNIPIGLQYGPEPPAALVSKADLTVGQSMMLSGGSVTSTGKVSAPEGIVVLEGVAGDVQAKDVTAQSATLRSSQNLVLEESQLRTTGDLNLLAQQTVRVRDSVDKPFVAQAGGQLLVQGNHGVDIFALNHPSSGLFSGGNMVLRSANTVGGDAHYTAGGSFQIEQLDGSPGSLFSPYDPVILANGDVRLASYKGASLHILAGGSVTIDGNVEITSTDNVNFRAENIVLSDGTTVAINGSTEPTLDIRAGINWTQPGPGNTISDTLIDHDNDVTTPPIFENSNPLPTFGGSPTSADIVIGSITNICCAGVQKRVFLTNQYRPNTNLTGSIRVGIIAGQQIAQELSIEARRSDVTIDSRGDINIEKNVQTSVAFGDAGEVRLLAEGNIITDKIESFVGLDAAGNGGNITLISTNGFINTSGGELRSNSITGLGGNVTLSAAGQITTAAITSESDSGNSGDISISSSSGGIDTSRGDLSSSSKTGSGGYVTLSAAGQITTAAITSKSESGNSGSIYIRSSAGGITSTGLLNSQTTSGQFAGYVFLDALGQINTTGITASSESLQGGTIDDQPFAGGIYLISRGDAGGINTSGGTLAATSNSGQGGYIFLDAIGQITTADITSQSVSGDGGSIKIRSRYSNVDTSGGELSNKTASGNAQNITLDANLDITTADITSSSDTGNSGSILLSSTIGSIDTTRGTLTTQTKTGKAGNVSLDANLDLKISDITASSAGNLPAGDLTLTSNRELSIVDGVISSQTRGAGKGGSIALLADSISLKNSQLSTSTFGQGNSGSISVIAKNGGTVSLEDNSSIQTSVELGAGGEGSNINITADSVFLRGGSRLEAQTRGSGKAGDILVDASDTVEISGFSTYEDKSGENQVSLSSGILTSTEARDSGKGGDIIIGGLSKGTLNLLQVSDGGVLSALTRSSSNGGNIKVDVNTLEVTNGGQLIASTFSDGAAGNILVDATDSITISGSNPNFANANGSTGNVNPTGFGRVRDVDSKQGPRNNDSIDRAQEISFNSFSVRKNDNIEFSTEVPHLSIISTGTNASKDNSFDYYSFEVEKPGTRGVFDIDRGSTGGTSNLDTELFLFDANGILLTSNDDSSTSSGANGSTNGRESYFNYDFRSPGTYIIGVGKYPSSSNGGSITGESLQVGDQYTIQLSLQARDNPNQGANSGLFAQSNGSGNAGNLTLNTRQLTVENQGIISTANTTSNAVSNITLQGLDTLEVNNGLISATTKSGQAGNITVNARESVLLNGTLTPTPGSESQGGLLAAATAGGNAGNLTITTDQLTIGGGAGAAVSSDGGSGNAGNVDISARVVALNSRGEITADTEGGGSDKTGTIDLRNLETLSLDNARISSSTQSGVAGSVSIDASKSVAVNNSLISSSAQSGTAGSVTVNALDSVTLSGTTTSQSSSKPVGGVLAQATAGGNAGDLKITTNQLLINNGAAATVSSQGLTSQGTSGNAGDVTVTASTVKLNSGGQISADTDQGGSPGTGNVFLQKLQTLDVNNGLISSSTNSGFAGSVIIDAAQSVLLSGTFIPNGSDKPQGGVLAEAKKGGEAGAVRITTNQLTIDKGAAAAVSSQEGAGNAGDVTVTASTVKLDSGGQISADTDQGGSPGTGNVFLKKLQTLDVNNGLISSSTNSGFAGSVIIDAAQSVLLSGTFIPNDSDKPQGGVLAEAKRGGEAGAVRITTNQLTIDKGAAAAVSSQEGAGNAGDVTVTANTVKLNRGGQIAAETDAGGLGRPSNITLEGLKTLEVNEGSISASTNTGVAGSLSINASDSVSLDEGSRIAVTAKGENGTAGNLTINTRNFLVRDGSEVSVSSPQGFAGNLNVNAGFIGLNRGSITAEAGQGQGGANIDLNVTGFLRLDNESLISALATGNATGGNINISAQYILASFPTASQGSDIVADAILGNGGQITINALGIFGIQFRPLRTPLNDITASSQSGASGTVQLTTLGIDPSRGLAALPLNFVDVSGLVGGQCSARSSADGEQSQFTIIGRGGLPLNPTDPLGPDAEQVHWVSLDSQSNWVSLNPEATTQMRITPFNSAANVRQLAQFPVLCYQSWLSPTTNAQ